MRDIEQTIREVNGTMAVEGMPLTDEDRSRLRDILYERVSIDDVLESLKRKYTAKTVQLGKQT